MAAVPNSMSFAAHSWYAKDVKSLETGFCSTVEIPDISQIQHMSDCWLPQLLARAKKLDLPSLKQLSLSFLGYRLPTMVGCC
jgi:hypothetical protein